MLSEKIAPAGGVNKVKIEDAEREHLQSFVDRFRAKASKADPGPITPENDSPSCRPCPTVIEERVTPFVLPSPRATPAPAAAAAGEGATVGYERRPADPAANWNLRLDIDDRIGLLGVNGAGKSTFAKLVAGALTVRRSGKLHRSSQA